MILTKNFLESILPAFSQDITEENTELNYDGHYFNAELTKNEDGVLTITVKHKSSKEIFERWCKQIDDDIFVEACEKFEELTGKTLKEAEEDKLYSLFETVVKEIARSKIDKLKRYL